MPIFSFSLKFSISPFFAAMLLDLEIKTLASEYFAPLSIAESIAISRSSNM